MIVWLQNGEQGKNSKKLRHDGSSRGQITYNEASQGKKIGLYFKRGGSHRSVLNLGMIRSDLGFSNLILVAVRRIDVRVTRVEVERE